MWMTRVSINNPVFATMVMVALCVLGLFSYQRLGVEQMPDISPPVVFVAVQYPGASPGAVETEITKPLEDALNGIAGVKMIRSNSYEGRSETVVEFNLSVDMTRATQEVRDKVSVVQSGFNRDVKPPFVSRFDGDNSQPTVTLALMANGRSDRELSLIADQTVQKRLTSVEGVARVTPLGLVTRQVRIDLDPQRLRGFGLTPADVSAALVRANTDQPVGMLQSHNEDSLVRVEGRVLDPKQFANVVVSRNASGGVVMLGDVGKLVEREQEPDSLSRINGKAAVTFNIYKQQDANIVRTGAAIKAAAEEMRKSLPPGVELKLIYASSDWVEQSLDGVKKTLGEGALLTIAIVFLFLHSWRSTIITGLTLPISVIASFIAINAFGFTLNFMTMMALSLCIGLLIDDAIVVRENIVRHVGMGQDHHTAARKGTDEIGLAVMATTFAICAVFVPVAFMKGIVGKFFFPFGITVVSAVIVSLFVSFTLDPMLSSIWKRPAGRHDAQDLGHRPHDARRRLGDGQAARRLRAPDHLGLQRPPLPRVRAAGAGLWLRLRRARPAPDRRQAPPALRDADPARHRAVVRGRHLRRGHRAGHDHRRRGDPADRPELHRPARSRCRWAPAWRAPTRR